MENLMRKKQRKFLVGFGLVIAAIGYLIYTGVTDATMYYLTVSELKAAIETGDVDYDENMRLHGKVLNGSIERVDVGSLRIRFMAHEGGMQTSVIYTGVVPDTFRDESEVVVEGGYGRDGTFNAHTLYAKCPSKYESEEGYGQYEQTEPKSPEPLPRS
jgi:cytochrome c-type biogenesis protein CcmE